LKKLAAPFWGVFDFGSLQFTITVSGIQYSLLCCQIFTLGNFNLLGTSIQRAAEATPKPDLELLIAATNLNTDHSSFHKMKTVQITQNEGLEPSAVETPRRQPHNNEVMVIAKDVNNQTGKLSQLTDSDVTSSYAVLVSKSMPDWPKDVVLLIFDFLGEGAGACLGLTYKDFWSMFKTKHPGKTHLSAEVTTTRLSYYIGNDGEEKVDEAEDFTDLGSLLHHWMGAEYRICSWNADFFLSRKVYGDALEYGEICGVEKELQERWEDYRERRSFLAANPGITTALPSPFNKGNPWHTESLQIILLDIRTQPSRLRFWTQCQSFRAVTKIVELAAFMKDMPLDFAMSLSFTKKEGTSDVTVSVV
jgi:hypothetical protein